MLLYLLSQHCVVRSKHRQQFCLIVLIALINMGTEKCLDFISESGATKS